MKKSIGGAGIVLFFGGCFLSAWAHTGHGEDGGSFALSHYLLEPVHAVAVLAGFAVAVLAGFAARGLYRRKKHAR